MTFTSNYNAPENMVFNINILNRDEYPEVSYVRLEVITDPREEGDPISDVQDYINNNLISRDNTCTINIDSSYTNSFGMRMVSSPQNYCRFIFYDTEGSWEMDKYQPINVFFAALMTPTETNNGRTWEFNIDVRLNVTNQIIIIEQLKNRFRGVSSKLWDSFLLAPYIQDKTQALPYAGLKSSGIFNNKYNGDSYFWERTPTIPSGLERNAWAIMGAVPRYLQTVEIKSRIDYYPANSVIPIVGTITGGTVTFYPEQFPAEIEKVPVTSSTETTIATVPIGSFVKMVATPPSGYIISNNIQIDESVGLTISGSDMTTQTGKTFTFKAVAESTSGGGSIGNNLLIQFENFGNPENDFNFDIDIYTATKRAFSVIKKEKIKTISFTLANNPSSVLINNMLERYITTSGATGYWYGEIKNATYPVTLEDDSLHSYSEVSASLILTGYNNKTRAFVKKVIEKITGWSTSKSESELSSFDKAVDSDKKITILSGKTIYEVAKGQAELGIVGATTDIEKKNVPIQTAQQRSSISIPCYATPNVSGRHYIIKLKNKNMTLVNTSVIDPRGKFSWEISSAYYNNGVGNLLKEMPYDLTFTVSKWRDESGNTPTRESLNTFTLKQGLSSGELTTDSVIINNNGVNQYNLFNQAIEMTETTTDTNNQSTNGLFTYTKLTIGKDIFEISYNS